MRPENKLALAQSLPHIGEVEIDIEVMGDLDDERIAGRPPRGGDWREGPRGLYWRHRRALSPLAIREARRLLALQAGDPVRLRAETSAEDRPYWRERILATLRDEAQKNFVGRMPATWSEVLRRHAR